MKTSEKEMPAETGRPWRATLARWTRRYATWGLVLADVTLAGLFLLLGWWLPGRAEVEGGFGRAEQVVDAARRQVAVFRRQIDDLDRPEHLATLQRLQAATQRFGAMLKAQRVDYDDLSLFATVLGDLRGALDAAVLSVDDATVSELATRSESVAQFLEAQLAPAAGDLSGRLDDGADWLRANQGALQTIAADESFQKGVGSLREMVKAMRTYDAALAGAKTMLDPKLLEDLKATMEGFERSVTLAQKNLDDYSVRMRGILPYSEEAGEMARSLDQSLQRMRAARVELGKKQNQLPKLQAAVDESQQLVVRVRGQLEGVVRRQEEIQAVLRLLPQQIDAGTDQMAGILDRLALVFRDAEQVRQMAAVLRAVGGQLSQASTHWSRLQSSARRISEMLAALEKQFHGLVAQRGEWEQLQTDLLSLTQSLSQSLTLSREQLLARVEEHKLSLASMEGALASTGNVLGEYQRNTVTLLPILRTVCIVFALLASFHGVALAASRQS